MLNKLLHSVMHVYIHMRVFVSTYTYVHAHAQAPAPPEKHLVSGPEVLESKFSDRVATLLWLQMSRGPDFLDYQSVLGSLLLEDCVAHLLMTGRNLHGLAWCSTSGTLYKT